MRILVLGGGGQVSRAVAATAPAHHELTVLMHAELDIGVQGEVERAVAAARPAWIVNGAAYTAVDLAEEQVEQARRINESAVAYLAGAAATHGARLLQLSTDFVFDGSAGRAYAPGAPTHPLSVYGLTKRDGERAALASDAHAVVLRTAWVYAAQGRNFVLTMLKLMRERDELRVVADQIGAPTWATGLAGAIWGLIDAAAPTGLYHWTDLGVASWYDFAVAIQEEALVRGLLSRPVPITPIATAAYPTRARRPAFSVLETESTRVIARAPARHWREHLRMMLDELRTA